MTEPSTNTGTINTHTGSFEIVREPQKSFIVTWLLSWFFGYFGIDRFYLGKIGTGLLKLITAGGFGVWYIIDLILVLANAQTDKYGRRLAGYDDHKVLAIVLTVIFEFGGVIILFALFLPLLFMMTSLAAI